MNQRGRIWTTVSLLVLVSMLLSTAPAFAQDGTFLPFMQNGTAAETVLPSPEPTPGEPYSYVVFMAGSGSVARGQVEGLSASGAQSVEALEAAQASTLAAVGASPDALLHNYTHAFNGFAAMLTPDQVQAMEAQPGVTLVLRDQMRYPDQEGEPASVGVTEAGDDYLADRSYGGYLGEDVIVGVIDSGIWPEHPSFADDGSYSDLGIVLDETSYPACDFGNIAHNPDDAPFTCNNKLLGARQVLDTYRSLIGAEPFEFDSARDGDGHGTHTASTAAGNANVSASIYGRPLGKISGIAPRARVIAYKGLGALGGFTSDLAASIDQAVADGVDVINYSIGGGAGTPGADEIAFLFAADAGVFVATSAGNSGPGDATLGNPGTMPWMTTVGANTQKRFYQGTIVLGNGMSYRGASITPGIKQQTPLVDAEFAGGDLCVPGTLDPNIVADKIVLCRRGSIARAAKSLAVYQAGGAGMIMYENTDDNNLFTDTHWVPTVHIDNTPGLAIKAYIASDANPTAKLNTGQRSAWPSAPSMTIFSSRGPNPVVTGAEDLIKPDITAPGIQILAGYSPYVEPDTTPPGELFAAIAGTSMSSPHMAGYFALMKEAHPDWSAAAAKSAYMTTANPKVVDNDRVSPATPFSMGAGEVFVPGRDKVGSAFQPGLVYDAGFNEYLGFLCDAYPAIFTDPEATCGFLAGIGIPTDAYNLNVPSIGVANVPGTKTVIRTVTSVAKEQGWREYSATVEAPEGYEVTVDPSTLRLKSGDSATFEVTFTNLAAPVGEWRFGSLTWTDKTKNKSGHYNVRSPIAVKGGLFEAPASISGAGESGTASFDVSFGYTGDYTAAAHGLAAAIVTDEMVEQDPDQTFDPNDGYSVGYPIPVSDALYLRIAMPPDSVPDPDADIDLFLYDPSGTQVASSTAGGTDELIEIDNPIDGTWTIYVHGWAVPSSPMPFNMWTWVVPNATDGSLVLDSAPTSATQGSVEPIDLSWTGATAGEWFYGAVTHSDASGVMGTTLVEVDNRAVAP